MVSEKAWRTFFSEVHRSIAEASQLPIAPVEILYPPGQTFSEEEIAALQSIRLIDHAGPALQKLFAHACGSAFFQVFTVMDGVVDPRNWEAETWLGMGLSSRSEEHDDLMLHDQFLETYQD